MQSSHSGTTATDLGTPYPLAADAIEHFAADGFVRLPGLLGPETVRHFEPTITGEVLRLNEDSVPLAEGDTYRRAFLQVTNLWRLNEAVRGLVFSRRLAQVAARLLRVDGVRLYHDQALYKEPDGGITPWHADQYYWPFASDRTVTVWIPLQDTPIEMGALEFARGSHGFQFGRDLPISDESERELQRALLTQGFDVDQAPYALGDASFHLGWTFHRAGPNASAVPRRAMTVIFMDADIVVSEPTNENRRADLAAFMPGVPVGAVPDTELNPVLYRASDDSGR